MLTMAATGVALPTRLPAVLAAANAPEPATEVHRPLEGTIAVLRSGDQLAVIITVDLLFIGRVLRTSVEHRLRHMVRPDQLIMAASHTHYAPSADVDKPLLGEADADWVEEIAALLAEQAERLLNAAGRPVDVLHGTGVTGVAVNRRRSRVFAYTRSGARWRTTVRAPNPDGYVDRTIHVVEFRDAGVPIAALWSLACHPVSLARSTAVDSHYVGHVRDLLRDRAGSQDLPVLFFQGFAGDCRPNVPRRARSLRGLAQLLLTGEGFGPFPSRAAERAWMHRLATDVAAIHCAPVAPEPLRTARVTLPRSRFVASSSSYPVSFGGLRMGGLSLIGGSAEFVGEYRDLILGTGTTATITAGYLDDVVGYAPTSQMIPRGGYEVEGFCRSFSVEEVNPTIESAVRLGFREVLAALEADRPGAATR